MFVTTQTNLFPPFSNIRCSRLQSFNVFIPNRRSSINHLKPTGHVMHQQFNIQQLYVLPTLYLCVLYLSENKQRLVPLTAITDWFLSQRWKGFTARYGLGV